MEQVSQSPFLQSLGYALINSLWQFALLWLVYVCIHSVYKSTSHQKYCTGLVLQLGGFFWFAATIYQSYQSNIFLAQNAKLYADRFSSTSVEHLLALSNLKLVPAIIHAEQFLPYLSIIYIFLLAFFGIKWLNAYKYTQNVRTKDLQKANVGLRLFVQRLSAQLGIQRTVSIYLSGLVKTPLTIGFFKPIILIPLASINHLSAEQMEAVVLHELAHIRRCDYLINLCLALVEVTLFFNPFMHLIAKHIKKERENCCDDWVLQYEYNAAAYAYALLTLASFQSSSPAMALAGHSDRQVLLNRIKRMIEKKEKTLFHYRHQLMALLVISIVFCSLAFFSHADRSNKADIVSYNPGAFPDLYSANTSKSIFLLPAPSQSQSDTFIEDQKDLNEKVTSLPHQLVLPPALTDRAGSNLLLPEEPLPPSPPVPQHYEYEYKYNDDQDDQDDNAELASLPVEADPEIFTEQTWSTQKQLKKLVTVLLNEKNNFAKLQNNQPQVAALGQLIASIELKIAKLSFSARIVMKQMDFQKKNVLITPSALPGQEYLKSLAFDIQQSVEQAKQQCLSLKNEMDLNFHFDTPPVEYAFPPVETAPEVLQLLNKNIDTKVIRYNKNLPVAKKKNKTIVAEQNDDIEWSDSDDVPASSGQPEKVKSFTRQNTRVVRI